MVRITLQIDRHSVSYHPILVSLTSHCESRYTGPAPRQSQVTLTQSSSLAGCSRMSWLQLTPEQHYRFKYDHTQRLDVSKGYMIACAPIGHVNGNCSRYQQTVWFRSHNEAIDGQFPVGHLVTQVWTRMFLVDHPDLTTMHDMSYGYFLYSQPLN